MEPLEKPAGSPARKKLDDLPENENEMWDKAEVHGNINPQPAHTTGPHFFIRKSGREAQCTHCDWGFALEPGDRIENEHLYDKTSKLVI